MRLGCSGFIRWRAVFGFAGPSLYGKAGGWVCVFRNESGRCVHIRVPAL